MTRKPTRAALHRLIGVDTRIDGAICDLSIGAREGKRELADAGIDLGPMIKALEELREKVRAHARSMYEEWYPRQPGAPAPTTNTR